MKNHYLIEKIDVNFNFHTLFVTTNISTAASFVNKANRIAKYYRRYFIETVHKHRDDWNKMEHFRKRISSCEVDYIYIEKEFRY